MPRHSTRPNPAQPRRSQGRSLCVRARSGALGILASLIVAMTCACPAAAQKCRFPWPEGQTATVTQSWCSKCTSGHCTSLLNYAIDFALPAGTPVLAAYEGTVAFVEENVNHATCNINNGGWGNTVVINHGDGSFTRYAHLQYQSVPVSVGQYVCAGRQIGTVGCTGAATGPHIHFQVQHAVDGNSVSFQGFVETGAGNIPNCNSTTPASQNRRATTSAECFVASYQGQTQSPPPGTWVRPSSDIAMSVTYKNIGGATWVKGPGGVSNARYIELRSVLGNCTLTNGALFHTSWTNAQRIAATQQDSVTRNQSGVFAFTARAPSSTGYFPQVQWVGPYAASTCVEGWAGVNFEVRVDGIPPTAGQSGGPAPGNYRTNQTISFGLSDGSGQSGVRGYCASWDNPSAPGGPCVASSGGSTSLAAAGTQYTPHTLYIHAYDLAEPPNVSTTNLGAWSLSPNRAPIFAICPGTTSTAEGSPLSFSISATDPDGDGVTIAALSLPVGATFDGSAFNWTPGFDQAGGHVASFRASDGALTSDCSVAIQVSNTNRAPVAICPAPQEGSEGVPLAFSVGATDPDGGNPTIEARALPAGASFLNGNFQWTPTYEQAGSHQARFLVSDGSLSDSCAVAITIANLNRSPVIACGTDTIAVAAGDSLNLLFTATDPDGTKPSLEATATPSGAEFDGGELRWLPLASQAGWHEFRVLASDGELVDSCTVAIEVTAIIAAEGGGVTRVELLPARPNPLSGSTTLGFALPAADDAELAIFDLRGRLVSKVASGPFAAGIHHVRWTARDEAGRPVAGGVYFVRLKTTHSELKSRLVVLSR